MTKEELEKEAEDWIGDYTSVPCSCMFLKYDYTNLVEAYIASAEPREKRIAELEKENAELKETIKKGSCCGDWNDDFHTCQVYLKHEELQKYIHQLTKAKEIIKSLIDDLRYRSYEPVKDIERAVQFLKEGVNE